MWPYAAFRNRAWRELSRPRVAVREVRRLASGMGAMGFSTRERSYRHETHMLETAEAEIAYDVPRTVVTYDELKAADRTLASI